MRLAMLLAVAAVSAWPAAPADAATANLLANGGFEQVEAQGMPSGWSLSWQNTHSNDRQRGVTKQRPDFAVDADIAHTGARSVRIGVRRPVDDGVLSYMTQVPADPAVAVYRASAWIRTRGLKGTTARMIAVSLGDRGKWLGADYTLLVADRDHDWTRYAAFFEPHKGARSIRIRLWVNFEYSGTGTAWFDDVAFEPTTLKEVPPARYADASPLPPLTAEDRRRGYLPFVRNILETVYPASMPRPGERLSELRLTGFPGEDEAATMCVRAIEPIAEMTLAASALRGPKGGLIPAQNVRVQPVECLVRQGQSRWGRHADAKMLKPVYVAETTRTSVARDTTRQLWITVSVPRDAPAGDYAGQVSLTTAKAAWAFPITMRVYPFALPEVRGIALGMYGRLHEDDAFVDYVFADMRRHGMTTVGLCCPLGAEMEMDGGKVRVRFDGKSALERAMRAYIKAGFPEPVVWLMGSDVVRWCRKQGALGTDAFAAAYKGVLEAILAKAGASKWPPIVFQPIDEPFEHTQRLATAKRCLQVMKTIPGLRTEEDGPNGNPRTLEELYALSDVLVYHDGPWLDRRAPYDAAAWDRFLARAKADGKAIWFYNIDLTGYHPEAMRWGYGFGLWAGRGQGVIEWAYMFWHRPHLAKRAYTNPKTMFFRYPKTADHPGGPSIGWEAVREGVKDTKLLRLFWRKAAEAEASGDPRRRAAAMQARAAAERQLARLRFDKLKARAGKGRWTEPWRTLDDGTLAVSGAFKMDNGWTFADYDLTRRLLADAIVDMAPQPPQGKRP